MLSAAGDERAHLKAGVMKATSLLYLFCSLSLFAQAPSATVVGRITDPSGAVVPGIQINLTSVDRNVAQQGTSNGLGDFTIPYVQPGRYTLEARGDGFRGYRHAEFKLALDQILRIDIQLEVGATTESVTVTETVTVLNTESGARGEVATEKEITDIPLDGRNFTDLAFLTGGVIPKGDGGDGSSAVNDRRAED